MVVIPNYRACALAFAFHMPLSHDYDHDRLRDGVVAEGVEAHGLDGGGEAPANPFSQILGTKRNG